MLAGCTPFVEEEHFAIFKRILAGTGAADYKPPAGCSEVTADFLSKLLTSNPGQRLTSTKGAGREVRFLYTLCTRHAAHANMCC